MTFRRYWIAALALLFIVAGCATQPFDETSEGKAALRGTSLPDRAIQERLLAVDPEHINEADIRDVRAKGPTPGRPLALELDGRPATAGLSGWRDSRQVDRPAAAHRPRGRSHNHRIER